MGETSVSVGQVAVGLTTGVLAGLVFFGGLAATVRRLPTSRRPLLLMVGSLAGRLAVAGAALTGAALVGPSTLVGAAVALVMVRWLFVRRPWAAFSTGHPSAGQRIGRRS